MPTRTSPPPLYLDVPRAGRAFGLGRGRAYEAARKGQIPTVAFGRAFRVPTAKIADMLGVTVDELWERLGA